MSEREHDDRPWGSYTVLEQGDGWKVKRIDVNAGARLSYQRHEKRAEHWLVVAGHARVTLDEHVHELAPGEAIDIPAGTAHRIENPGDTLLTFVEIQRGEYLGEDDIERLSDDYGREGS